MPERLFTKRQYRELRSLAREAHEEELRRALEPLAAAFDTWRGGELGSGELAHRIHEFHQRPNRDLFKRYNHSDVAFMVARAVMFGVLEESAVPPEILEKLQPIIRFARELQDPSWGEDDDDDEG